MIRKVFLSFLCVLLAISIWGCSLDDLVDEVVTSVYSCDILIELIGPLPTTQGIYSLSYSSGEVSWTDPGVTVLTLGGVSYADATLTVANDDALSQVSPTSPHTHTFLSDYYYVFIMDSSTGDVLDYSCGFD